MIRASIGNAVIDSDAPKNNIASIVPVRGMNKDVCLTKSHASPAPKTNGTHMPAIETATELR